MYIVYSPQHINRGANRDEVSRISVSAVHTTLLPTIYKIFTVVLKICLVVEGVGEGNMSALEAVKVNTEVVATL